MPQRFLRPGITDSERWNSCCWQVQSFYIRLITLVDDFGRYDGNPKLIRGHAFALREDVTSERISEMLLELQKSSLIELYQVSDKQYIQMKNWQETPRATKSRFPDNVNDCKQMKTNVNNSSPPSLIAPRSSTSPSSSTSPKKGEASEPSNGAVKNGTHTPLSSDRNLPPSELILRQTELKRVEEAIRGIRGRNTDGIAWSETDKTECKRLKKRKEELVKMLKFAV